MKMSSENIDSRKNRHLRYFTTDEKPHRNFFDDIYLFNSPLAPLNTDAIDTGCTFSGSGLSFPAMISAVTGGTDEGAELNRLMAQAAAVHKIAFQSGSIRIALENPELTPHFQLNRQKELSFYALNIGAVQLGEYPVSQISDLMCKTNAHALFIHLNKLQELAQDSGDRDFSQIKRSITETVKNLGFPVFLKETGCGFGPELLEHYIASGIAGVDTGGYGGTDFLEIENQGNSNSELMKPFENWGVPTPVSVMLNKSKNIELIAGGGVRNGLDALKALAVGANLVSFAGPVVRAYYKSGLNGINNFLKNFFTQFRYAMLLTGISCIDEIPKLKYSISHQLESYLNIRKS
ncbi:MAG: type 2 isopentenyl-diphosphate Delta-isomerase [Deltaproteobacteria bacterium]|nr:type 2 isopentenyl-diphosphate Delta-isomerase [Deltaproteobacteria bacterium]